MADVEALREVAADILFAHNRTTIIKTDRGTITLDRMDLPWKSIRTVVEEVSLGDGVMYAVGDGVAAVRVNDGGETFEVVLSVGGAEGPRALVSVDSIRSIAVDRRGVLEMVYTGGSARWGSSCASASAWSWAPASRSTPHADRARTRASSRT